MKATGIVRRIDDLGRVVIPKEIRRTLRIREGDPLEIFTDREGQVILKKYSPIGELGMVSKIYAESLAQTMNCTVCITDTDQVVAVAGYGKKELEDQYISGEFLEKLQGRKQVLGSEAENNYTRIGQETNSFTKEVINPILSGGDVIGAVVFLGKDEKNEFDETVRKVALSAADFLGRQMN